MTTEVWDASGTQMLLFVKPEEGGTYCQQMKAIHLGVVLTDEERSVLH